MHAAGGVEEFLSEHAVIVMADHSQAPVTATIALQDDLAELGVLGPVRSSEAGSPNGEPRIAVCPSQRAAMVYALHESSATPCARRSSRSRWRSTASTWSCGSSATRTTRPREGVISSPRHGELRFAPGGAGGNVLDPRGASWSVEGELAAIDGRVEDGLLLTPDYPDALARTWSALNCRTSGEVLLSAAPGYEFVDWGRQAHVGGGSHGSLHASDSLGALVLSGVALPEPEPAQWAIRDVAPLVLEHFGLDRSR